MSAIPVIAIFDVGKTNKKLFLFDENYKIVYEKSARFIETVDEDGDPCENLESLRSSIFDSLSHVINSEKEFEIKAINFSTYGASFVYIDKEGYPLAPLYSYLKVYPEALKKQFYDTYGGETTVSGETASPVLGNLNSGMQLYRMKYEKPQVFARVKYALHLPQYLSFLLTGKAFSDITSIGCHTNMWDFTKNDYHRWIKEEGILEKLAPIVRSDKVIPVSVYDNDCEVGIGLHDSSAALIPYLVNFHQPFLLLSTGTWNISLNPFNQSPLTKNELANDCLCYMQYKGKPVKASRIFAGFEHEQQVQRIATHFDESTSFYKSIRYNPAIIDGLKADSKKKVKINQQKGQPKTSAFTQRDLSAFQSATEAYHQLILDIIEQQYESTQFVLKGTHVKRIFVDGGFSKNPIFMNLLAATFPNIEVFAASMAQATAIGAAMAIHNAWNSKPIPNDVIDLKYYSVSGHSVV